MKPTSVIVIGGSVPAEYRSIPAILIALPGEVVCEWDFRGAYYPARDLDDCLLFLRNHYSDHQTIATLGGCLIVADHPIEGSGDTIQELTVDKSPAAIRREWAPRIEAKLCELLDDLGNCMLDSWKGALHTIWNGERIAACPSSRELMYAHAGELAVVIGSGPSASDHLDHIAKIRKGVRIFAADTMLSGLLAHGIVPDYVCAIERESNITEVLSKDAQCGATLIASPVVEPDCIRPWGDKVLFWWGADDLYRWLSRDIEPMPSGRSAGALALAAAAQAGCSSIYLVGHDLSYRDGQSHAKDAHQIAHSANLNADTNAHPADPSRQRHQVEANHGGTIETNGLWNRIRGDLEGIIANHQNWKVVNVCNHGGARIAGAPVGDLPSMPMDLAPIQPMKPSGIDSPFRRTASIVAAITVAEERIESASRMLEMGADSAMVSEALQVSRLFGERHASLFHYITRSLYNGITVRLHLSASNGMPQDECMRNALGITIRGLSALIQRMKKELPS